MEPQCSAAALVEKAKMKGVHAGPLAPEARGDARRRAVTWSSRVERLVLLPGLVNELLEARVAV